MVFYGGSGGGLPQRIGVMHATRCDTAHLDLLGSAARQGGAVQAAAPAAAAGAGSRGGGGGDGSGGGGGRGAAQPLRWPAMAVCKLYRQRHCTKLLPLLQDAHSRARSRQERRARHGSRPKHSYTGCETRHVMNASTVLSWGVMWRRDRPADRSTTARCQAEQPGLTSRAQQNAASRAASAPHCT